MGTWGGVAQARHGFVGGAWNARRMATSPSDEQRVRAADVIKEVDDQETLARLAGMACAGIEHTSGHERLAVLTELTHTVRAVADAAERAAGQTDEEVSRALWHLTGAIGSRLTEQPLPVLRGEPLPDPDDT